MFIEVGKVILEKVKLDFKMINFVDKEMVKDILGRGNDFCKGMKK